MLTIPSSVKALYYRDGVRKNFRVHFPNGEFSDITGDSVDTVTFTESLCSQDTLTFGLAEASVLEFEAVGVDNMFGMVIDAGIEVDITSLSAADIAAIEAGTWDGTLVKAAQSDIGYGFFRIPYGRFLVCGCPRQNGNMKRRTVTAYSLEPDYQAILSQYAYSYDLTATTLEDVAQGALEVNAMFLKADRLGGHEMIRLDNAAPLSVTPGDYSEAWWDEYDVDSIGTVKVAYLSSGGEETAAVSLGVGSSVYDMTSNELLRNLENADLASVTGIITTDFAPHLAVVRYTPVELTMRGLPWLEAGDALELEAADGTIVDTYALRVETRGIQRLVSTITATGGELIEEG